MITGTHCILELYDCPAHLLNDLAFIQHSLRQAASHAGSTWLKDVSHQFTPSGITALALLAESHIAIHTWTQEGYLAADIFTCGDRTQPQQACEFLIQAFCAGSHRLVKVSRGTGLGGQV